MNVIKSEMSVETGRLYQLAETPIGRVLFFQFGECDNLTQYRNITLSDWAWTIKPTTEFLALHNVKPVETFLSKRLNGFAKVTKVNGGGSSYQIARKRNDDGYIYEIPSSDLRAFPKKDYPDMKFAYTRYHVESIRHIEHLSLERLKTEEAVRNNGGWVHSVHAVSTIVDAVYKAVAE